MKVKASELEAGMIVIHSVGKGILTIESVVTLESYPEQYKVTYFGISYPDIYEADAEVEVISDEDE
jgi:hypothetical protein